MNLETILMMSQEMMNLIPMARKDGLLVPARVKTKTGEANQSLLMESLCKRLKPLKATESQQRESIAFLTRATRLLGQLVRAIKLRESRTTLTLSEQTGL